MGIYDDGGAIYENYGGAIDDGMYAPNYGYTSDISLSDMMDSSGYSGFGAGDNVPARQTASDWSNLSDVLRSFSGTVQDFGSSIINLQGTATQLDIQRAQAEAMATTAKQKLAIQQAKSAADYRRAIRNNSPVSRGGSTPNELLILGVVIAIAIVAARAH